MPRIQNVMAKQKTYLLKFPKTHYMICMQSLGFSDIEKSIEFLYNVPYFANEDMDIYDVIILAMKAQIVQFHSKTVVVQAEKRSKHIYFIMNGRFQVIQRLSNGKFIQIDILEKGDYYGHMNILNYDSEIPLSNNNQYVYSLLPSECLMIHENDILSLPKRVIQRLKQFSPPYPEEKELLAEFKDCLKEKIRDKNIIHNFLVKQDKPIANNFQKEFADIIKNQIQNNHNQIQLIQNLQLDKSPLSYKISDTDTNSSPYTIHTQNLRQSQSQKDIKRNLMIKDFNMQKLSQTNSSNKLGNLEHLSLFKANSQQVLKKQTSNFNQTSTQLGNYQTLGSRLLQQFSTQNLNPQKRTLNKYNSQSYLQNMINHTEITETDSMAYNTLPVSPDLLNYKQQSQKISQNLGQNLSREFLDQISKGTLIQEQKQKKHSTSRNILMSQHSSQKQQKLIDGLQKAAFEFKCLKTDKQWQNSLKTNFLPQFKLQTKDLQVTQEKGI
eukprot:403357465